MNYINIQKKKIVGRNNQVVSPLVIDYHTKFNLQFQFINSNNIIQSIDSTKNYYMAGSLKMKTGSGELLFLSKTFSISGDIITFEVDTYTKSFLTKIDHKGTDINIQIGSSDQQNKQEIFLRESALANPRVYVEGVPPIDLDYYYTKPQIDQMLSGMSSYTAGDGLGLSGNTFYVNSTIARTEELNVGLSSKLNKNNPTGTGTLSIPSAVINGTLRNGNACDSKGNWSHAEGQLTNANGKYSHAEGNMTKSNGFASHSEGGETIANGQYSHAEGNMTKSNGFASHSEGRETIANGQYSHAEGNNTLADGNASHSEGKDTIAYGYYSHVNGLSAVSYTAGSHVEGLGTRTHKCSDVNYGKLDANYAFQHIEGKYNDNSSNKIKDMQCVVGGGSADDDRKNIYTRDWYGNIWTSGLLSAAGFYDTTNNISLSNAIISKQDIITISNKLDYSLLSGTPTIPSKTSQLQNDSGFITSYTETDPVYTADKPSIALKSQLFSKNYNDLTNKPTIPSKTSQLQNDAGFISGFTETDPIYTAEKSTLALKSELFSGNYNDLTNKPSIPSALYQLTDDSTHRVVTDVQKTSWNAKADVEAYKLPVNTDATSNWLAAAQTAWTDSTIYTNNKKIIDLAWTNETYLNFPTISCSATQNYVRTAEVWIKMGGSEATGITSIYLPSSYTVIGDLPTALKGQDSDKTYTYHVFVIRFRANSSETYVEVAYSHAFNTNANY